MNKRKMKSVKNKNFRMQRQANLCEFKVNLVYRVSSRTARPTQRNPVSKNQNKIKIK